MQLACRPTRIVAPCLLAAALYALSVASLAHAEENVCAAFAWPLARELAALAAADVPKVESGGAATADATAVAIKLAPMADAVFVLPPERQPRRPDSFGGAVVLDALPKPGLYQVTLSAEAWLDVVQGGVRMKSVAFSGKPGCAGMRKSVRFELQAAPATIQISGAGEALIRLVVSPAE